MNNEELLNEAKEASKNAYAKYSNFHVGACALYDSGNSYRGCNVENGSYGLCLCAERNAIKRELFEETHQEVDYLEFKGLFKKTRPTGEIVYTAIYYTNKDQISEFIKNDLDENDKIMLWDLEEDIGYVDEIDNEIIKILQK